MKKDLKQQIYAISKKKSKTNHNFNLNFLFLIYYLIFLISKLINNCLFIFNIFVDNNNNYYTLF